MAGNEKEDPARWSSSSHGWLSGSPPSGPPPAAAPPAAALIGDGGSSPKARWTLALAITGSVLLLGAAVLFWGNDSPAADTAAVMPEPWQPPTAAASTPAAPEPVPVIPSSAASLPVTSANATTAPEEGDDDAQGDPPAPVTVALTLTQGAAPATLDLAAEGTRDWVHWGLTAPTSVDRRSGGTGEIRDLGSDRPRGRYDNNTTLFSWSGGTPAASASRTPTGVYVCGQGGTFTLSVPATKTTRTLRLYAGVWMAHGRLTATLAGRTATADLENRTTLSTNRFVISFRAPTAQTLRLTWTTTVAYHAGCGNVDLQAATLR